MSLTSMEGRLEAPSPLEVGVVGMEVLCWPPELWWWWPHEGSGMVPFNNFFHFFPLSHTGEGMHIVTDKKLWNI